MFRTKSALGVDKACFAMETKTEPSACLHSELYSNGDSQPERGDGSRWLLVPQDVTANVLQKPSVPEFLSLRAFTVMIPVLAGR